MAQRQDGKEDLLVLKTEGRSDERGFRLAPGGAVMVAAVRLGPPVLRISAPLIRPQLGAESSISLRRNQTEKLSTFLTLANGWESKMTYVTAMLLREYSTMKIPNGISVFEGLK